VGMAINGHAALMEFKRGRFKEGKRPFEEGE
jgi:hypothetical protein